MEINKRVAIHLVLTEKEVYTIKLALECCTDNTLTGQNNSGFSDECIIETSNTLVDEFQVICLR